MNSILSFLQHARSSFLDDLSILVNRDCGTYNKAGVDEVGEWVRVRGDLWDWQVEQFSQPEYGDCWLARIRGTGQGRVMLIGHLDTVYPDGTAAERPMRFEGTRILGPGVCDMKGGVLAGMYALRALQQAGFKDFEELLMFFNSEEEIGSPTSRALYKPIAREMDAVLVLEGGRANGNIVSARKGSAKYVLRATGKSAHAGVEPENGANAILELSNQIIAMHKLNGVAPGVTVNAGLIGGGTRTNVVPDHAWAEFDVRAVDPAGAEVAHQAIQALQNQTTVPGTHVSTEGHFEFAPMSKTPAIGLLVELAQQVAHELGFEVQDQATGGASDANTISSVGVPVLDGLGPIGGNDHSPDEYIDADSIVPRTALVARLIQRILAHRDQIAALRET